MNENNELDEIIDIEIYAKESKEPPLGNGNSNCRQQEK